MLPIDENISDFMRRTRKQIIPTSKRVVQETFQELGLSKKTDINPDGVTPADVFKNFNDYLRSVFDRSLVVLERYEDRVYPATLRELCRMRSAEIREIGASETEKSFDEGVADVLELLYPQLWRIFLSRSQSRKQRGGGDFEEQIHQLLLLSDLPCERQIRTYHTDFMMPSNKFFERDRTRSILLSAKRTLRERWQNVANEIYETRCPNAYLCTTDESVNSMLIERLRPHNIHLVVWDNVKEERFSDEPIVIGYTQLANVEIQTFKGFWS